MSDPRDRMIDDNRAAKIEEQTRLALEQADLLPPLAHEFALATFALLRDRQARCELATSESISPAISSVDKGVMSDILL